MTVGELIDELKRFPEDLYVVVEDPDTKDVVKVSQPFPPKGSVYLEVES